MARKRYAASPIRCAPRVATVDRDGHRINSARARTPHEPLSSVLMRFAYSSRAVAITLTSAHTSNGSAEGQNSHRIRPDLRWKRVHVHEAAKPELSILPRERSQGAPSRPMSKTRLHLRQHEFVIFVMCFPRSRQCIHLCAMWRFVQSLVIVVKKVLTSIKGIIPVFYFRM